MRMYALEDKKGDVVIDSENSKCFVAQTVGPMQKPFSHKRFVMTKSSKLDPILVYSDDFFPGQNLLRLSYISYHACGMQVIVLFQHKLSGLYFSTTFPP